MTIGRLLFASLFLATWPAAAQDFEVTSTVPAPGATDVAMQTTVTFTFSAPIDTSARFDGQGPLAFYTISPEEAIRIDSTYANEDLTQISFDVTHLDTTDYVWVLTGALSEDGEMLCNPHVLSYTTRSQRGGAIVRGWVSLVIAVKSGSCYTRGLVALLHAPPDSSAMLEAAAGVDSEWHFEMSGVRRGTYWPVFLVDWNADGLIRPDWQFAGNPHAEVVPYDEDFNERADSIVVTDTTDMEIIIGVTGGASERAAELPGTARLLQNYPNPSTGRTTFVFELERPLRASLVVYDLLGRQVARPVSGIFMTGRHEVTWNGDSATGLHVVRLEGEQFVLAMPFLVVR